MRRGRGNPGTVRYGDRLIFNRKDPPSRRQSLHELLERAGYLTHRTEGCHSQHSRQGKEGACHFPLRYEPHACYQNRERAEAGERLVQACLASLFCLKPNLSGGNLPTVARQVRRELFFAAETHQLSETLNAVDQAGVELAHGFSYPDSEQPRALLEE